MTTPVLTHTSQHSMAAPLPVQWQSIASAPVFFFVFTMLGFESVISCNAAMQPLVTGCTTSHGC